MWYQIKPDTITFVCKVKPNAKKTLILGVNNESLHIALHAPPVDGAANSTLIKFLAEFFNLPSRDINLLRGKRARIKLIAIPNQPHIQNALALF
jgi:uncharacterized protein (TIGR00251 family)